MTENDRGAEIHVAVTATRGEDISRTIFVGTGSLIPASAPFATNAGLTTANPGGITGSRSGRIATLTVPAGRDGDALFVDGYSAPVYLGSVPLDANLQTTVDFSALPDGAHQRALVNRSSELMGWYAVTIGTVGTIGSLLAVTGFTANAPANAPAIGWFSGGIALLGLFLISATRTRRGQHV